MAHWYRDLKETDRGRAALARAPCTDVRWTDAEDAALFKHVAQYGPREWGRCAQAVGTGRTAGAVSGHWHSELKETDRGRAALVRAPDLGVRWTDAEDAALFKHVAQYGPRSSAEWERCAKAMGTGRSAKAVRLRWCTALKDAVGGALWE